MSTNRDNPEVVLKFFNVVNDNKFVKSGAAMALPGIKVRRKIYVPKMVKEFELEETKQYCNMTD